MGNVNDRAEAWRSAGLMDLEFYSALRGRVFPDEHEAALDFVEIGMRERLSTHPLLDFATLPTAIRKAWREGRAKSVLRRLSASQHGLRPQGPLADHPDPKSARGHILGVAKELAQTRELKADAHLDDDFSALQSDHLDWTQVEASLSERVAGRTSIVIPTFADRHMTARAVESVLTNSEGEFEIILVDNGSPTHVALSLAAEYFEHSTVRLIRLPRNLNFAAGSNIGFARSTGDVVVFLNNDTEVHPGWLAPIRDALEDDELAGAQSLLLYPDGTIQSAGTIFLEGYVLPCHFLVGQPSRVAEPVSNERFAAITGAAMALRSSDVTAARGFDPAYRNGFEDVDLCLRLKQSRPGGFRVLPTSVVTHHESKTPGRFERAAENRRHFAAAWSRTLPRPLDTAMPSYEVSLLRVDDDGSAVPAPKLDYLHPHT